MKILLTAIILVFCICTSVILFKQYHAAESKKKIASPTTAQLTPTPLPVTLTNHDISHVEKTAMTVPRVKKPANEKKVAGLDVHKLIAVSSSQGLHPKALKSALNAYVWALDHGKLGRNKDILTVVDFTLPSYEKRMWVLSLHKQAVLMKLYTTQGSGSGYVYANRFSNRSMSQESSLGLFVTSDEYYGHHGKSMRLDGLQKGINNNARNREIVIHEASYASPGYVRAYHRAGRSWGCFAVAPSSKDVLLHYVKGGSAFFAYARPIERTSIISNGPIAI